MKIFGILILFSGITISSAQAQEGYRYWECKNPTTEETNENTRVDSEVFESEEAVHSNTKSYETSPSIEKNFSTPQGGSAPIAGERAIEASNTFEKSCGEILPIPGNVPAPDEDKWTAPTPPGFIFLKY